MGKGDRAMSSKTDGKLQFIFGRRCIRSYAAGEISEAVATKLLEATMATPSAGAKDPWRFDVVREQETLVSRGLGRVFKIDE